MKYKIHLPGYQVEQPSNEVINVILNTERKTTVCNIGTDETAKIKICNKNAPTDLLFNK